MFENDRRGGGVVVWTTCPGVCSSLSVGLSSFSCFAVGPVCYLSDPHSLRLRGPVVVSYSPLIFPKKIRPFFPTSARLCGMSRPLLQGFPC